MTEGSQVVVNYNLFEIGDASVQNISQTLNTGIEYSTNAGVTWFDATDAGGTSDGLVALAGSQTGTDHDFLWDAETDLGVGTFNNTLLRVRPSDGTSNALAWVSSNPFNVIILSASDSVLTQIGNEGDNPDITNSVITVAQLNNILPVLSNVTLGNEVAYQDYIDVNPDLFSSPATQIEVQNMVDTVNAQVVSSSSHRKKGSSRISKKQLAEIFGDKIKKEGNAEEIEDKKGTCHITYTRLIKKGLRGNDVKQVQICMNELGFSTGFADGIYGPLTFLGVTNYQRSQGLRFIDGLVGPETTKALNK